MSYASVLNQQTLRDTSLYFNIAGTDGTLQTVYSIVLKGTYLYSVNYKITSGATVTSADIRAGDTRSVSNPKSDDFSRSLSGIATGTFEVKQMYNQDTDNEVWIKLLKLN
jgi:hypothetical protein